MSNYLNHLRSIHLSGLKLKNDTSEPDDIEIKFTGLRPGEKLYEELLIGENVSGTKHSEIMRAEEHFLVYEELSKMLDGLYQACNDYNIKGIQSILLDNHIGYEPSQAINDLLWKQMNQK